MLDTKSRPFLFECDSHTVQYVVVHAQCHSVTIVIVAYCRVDACITRMSQYNLY